MSWYYRIVFKCCCTRWPAFPNRLQTEYSCLFFNSSQKGMHNIFKRAPTTYVNVRVLSIIRSGTYCVLISFTSCHYDGGHNISAAHNSWPTNRSFPDLVHLFIVKQTCARCISWIYDILIMPGYGTKQCKMHECNAHSHRHTHPHTHTFSNCHDKIIYINNRWECASSCMVMAGWGYIGYDDYFGRATVWFDAFEHCTMHTLMDGSIERTNNLV